MCLPTPNRTDKTPPDQDISLLAFATFNSTRGLLQLLDNLEYEDDLIYEDNLV